MKSPNLEADGRADREATRLSRRTLTLGAMLLAPGAAMIATTAAAQVRSRTDVDVARDEDYWAEIARAFRLDGRYIVLNGGGNNPLPANVVDALNRYDQMAASQPRPHNSGFVARLDGIRGRLAPHFGCDADELAITRNTTEGLNVVCWGLDLSAGDEVVISNFDHHYAGQIVRQRAARHGVVLREVALPLSPSQAEVIDAFGAALTPRSKLVVASHLVDGWGFVLPIRGISEFAHRHGAAVLADGALAFGHMPINVRNLGCDYYATSLHKWLNAPLGTGALYVKRSRIAALWPLYGVETEANDIRKFEQIGTRSGPTLAAIGQAIDFFEQVGPSRKLARVRYLLDQAMRAVASATGARIITERDPALRTGLARVVVDGLSGQEIMTRLREQHGIYTFGGFGDTPDGVYISPNIFNSLADIQAFGRAVAQLASR